ncbi:fructokinase [Microbacterium keratanolyticum]|uniref:carbohydrate kinase family protein n=1 Tax=Microbacterium keratanolyticum TaxID=67574 RepID=UPI001957BD38|nr:carbohydrate kinase [Microbacterium keratanolyticum]MBM7469041.1 fructokinase [Microbacterium keratanolyticum]
MSRSRLVVIGESLVDVIVEPSGTRTARPGGSPMNVAIGVARLGIEATLITAFGGDAYGALVREHIEREGVELLNGGREERATNEAIATLGADGAATYVFRLENHVQDAAALLTEREITHLHVGSLTAITDEEWVGTLAAVNAARSSATVSYDPNCRPDFGVSVDDARTRVEAFAAASDIIKASDEDLIWLYPGEEFDVIAKRWLAGGARLVVVTQGDGGPVGYTTGLRVSVATPRIDVTDTVGAGDSFMAAMLAWCDDHRMLGHGAHTPLGADDLGHLLGFAARAAAITCTRVGANPPTRAELDAELRA